MSKKSISLLIAFCLMAVTCAPGLTGTDVYAAEKKEAAIQGEYAEDEILVVFEDDVTEKAAEKVVADQEGEDLTVVDTPADEVTGVVELPKEQTVQEAVAEYKEDPDVAYAQPNYKYSLVHGESAERAAQQQAAAVDYLNDTEKAQLWHLEMIQALDAWDLLRQIDRTRVKVAVLDTGVDLSHEDLQDSLNKSLCVDVTGGRTVPLTGDDDGHGTHVSGIIAAEANNGLGVAGVASGGSSGDSVAEIFAVDVFTWVYNAQKNRWENNAYTSDIIAGLQYAQQKGAKVINMSLGYEAYNQTFADLMLENTVNNVTASNIAVICAAGNDNNAILNYPADFEASISVTSVNRAGEKSDFSNYGSTKDIAAPGGKLGRGPNPEETVCSTWPGNNYHGEAGTSMAAPVVSGVAAMLYSTNPQISLDTLKYVLYNTAVDKGAPGHDIYYGHGIINAYKAIEKVKGRATGLSLNQTAMNLKKGQTKGLSATITPSGARNNSVTWRSSNPSVATVDGSGRVTAKKGGTALITVRSNDLTCVYAACQVTVQYQVTYKLNGGKNHKSNPTSYYGRTVTLKNPTRKGYAFEGWYKDSKYRKRVKTISSGDHTLYAKWKKVKIGRGEIKQLKQTSKTKLKVSQKKVSGAKGYQITYSTSKKFTKKTTKHKNASGTSKTLTKLKKGKTYYVKTRAYKKDSAGKKVYGTYSKARKLKLKK